MTMADGPIFFFMRRTFDVATPSGARNFALVGLLQCGVRLADALSADGTALRVWGSYLGFVPASDPKGRRVSLSQTAGDALLRWLEIRLAYVKNPMVDPLFCTISRGSATGFGMGGRLRPGRRLSRSYVLAMLRRHGTRAGVEGLRPEMLVGMDGPRLRSRCSKERLRSLLKPPLDLQNSILSAARELRNPKAAATRVSQGRYVDAELVDVGAGEEGLRTLPTKPQGPPRSLRRTEASRLIKRLIGSFNAKTPTGARNLALVSLLLECDLRPGEALGVLGTDVKLVRDPERSVLRVGIWVGRGARRRRVLLTWQAWSRLVPWLTIRLEHISDALGTPIFCTISTGLTKGFGQDRDLVPGRPLRDSYVRRMVADQCDAAGIDRMSPDALRRLSHAPDARLALTTEEQFSSILPTS